MTEHLASRGRHGEAAQTFLDYAQDVDSAVDVLCRGNEFAEAYRIVRIPVRCGGVINLAVSSLRCMRGLI